MITPERRQILYTKMFQFMSKHELKQVPVDIFELCRSIDVKLVTLDEIVSGTGLAPDDIFSIWGNEDGAVNLFRDRHSIAYNNGMPAGRIRFTLCEELSHMIYGHTMDGDFNMFRQNYAGEIYRRYEEEARLGAGILVCHPKFYYTYQRLLTPESLSEICGITLPCARTRCEVFNKYKDEIQNNALYILSQVPRSETDLWKFQKQLQRSRQTGAVMETEPPPCL